MGFTSLEKPEITRPGKITNLRAFIVNSRMAARAAASASVPAASAPVTAVSSSELAIEQNINYFLCFNNFFIIQTTK